ncbi:calnexin [Sporobolomyces koalae]|uniref:calnexin n=1 Tax=Sporobolomyces koalae TaxID=500713 RepID=UPI003172EA8E
MKYALLPLTAFAALCTVVTAEGVPSFTPTAVEGIFVEQFTEGWQERWSPSKATKEEKQGEASRVPKIPPPSIRRGNKLPPRTDLHYAATQVFSYVGKWAVEEPSVYPGIDGDKGLVLKSKAAHHAISAPFDFALDPKGKPLIVSYEVKLQKGLDCGGAYVKLLSESDSGIQAEEFSDQTPYTIMFGPDRCGSTQKVHFIFRHRNPLTGEIEEKHLKNPPAPKLSKTTALYTLIVRPEDQSYEIKINDESVKKGSLLEDFTPSVNPSKEIDDPEDVKPSDWVENPKISDPDAVKPADWDEDAPSSIEDPDATQPEDWLVDEPATVPDPEAEKPEEWSDEDDGEWIAPQVPNPRCQTAAGCGPWKRPEIANPAYKGKWFAPLIDNPDYKGPWAPRKISNPGYYEDNEPANFNKIAGIGFELWSMTDDILFDNIFVGTSEADLATFVSETYAVKAPLELSLEEADKPEPAASTPEKKSTVVDFKQDPVAFVKTRGLEFLEKATVDPKRAFTEEPVVGGVVGIVFATLVGMLGVLISLLLPSSSSPAVKKSVETVKEKTAVAAKTVSQVTSDAAEKVQEQVAPIAEAGKDKVEQVKSGVRTRAKSAKQQLDEDK